MAPTFAVPGLFKVLKTTAVSKRLMMAFSVGYYLMVTGRSFVKSAEGDSKLNVMSFDSKHQNMTFMI